MTFPPKCFNSTHNDLCIEFLDHYHINRKQESRPLSDTESLTYISNYQIIANDRNIWLGFEGLMYLLE